MGTVYLIHFKTRYEHAGHYLGYTQALPYRLYLHRQGNGARLMEVVTQAGIDWMLIRVWENADRGFERKLKNRHGAISLCPVCNPKSWMKNGKR